MFLPTSEGPWKVKTYVALNPVRSQLALKLTITQCFYNKKTTTDRNSWQTQTQSIIKKCAINVQFTMSFRSIMILFPLYCFLFLMLAHKGTSLNEWWLNSTELLHFGVIVNVHSLKSHLCFSSHIKMSVLKKAYYL